MKSEVTITKKLFKMALQERKYDSTREAQGVIRDITINTHFEHIYRHKYNSVNFNELQQTAQLNVIFDNMKK